MLNLETRKGRSDGGMLVGSISEVGRKYSFLAKTIGMSIDELAEVGMSSSLAAHTGMYPKVDMSPFSPFVRLRFAKEFGRLFDGRRADGGPTPNFSMSVLFEGLDYGRVPSEYQHRPNSIIKLMASDTYTDFVGSKVVMQVGEHEEVGAQVLRIGATSSLVDRRAYYEGMYDGDEFAADFKFELGERPGNPEGQLGVREHTASLLDGSRELTIDLDQVTGIQIAR